MMTGTSIIGTRTMMAGTPGFQSPEQLRAEEVGIASDVYAFGCVMIVIFTEKPLWPGLNPYQIMMKVTVENVAPNTAGVSPKIEGLCNSCTSDKARPSIVSILQDLLKLATV